MTDIYCNSPVPPLAPQHRYSFAEDTNGSETDTVLDTPTNLSPLSSPNTSYPRWSLASAFSTAFSRHGISHKLKRYSELPNGGGSPRTLSNYLGSSSSASSSHRVSLFPFIDTQNNTPSIDTKLELPPSPCFSTEEQKQEEQQQHLMAPLMTDVALLGNHELIRVGRLLATVYRFEASRRDHSPSILDFISLLKAQLENWAEHPITAAHTAATKRAFKHVGRRPARVDIVFSKVQGRRRRRRQQQSDNIFLHAKQKRKQQQDGCRRETGDDQERALMDAIQAAQAPLLAEVTEIQRTLDGLRDEKEDVEQTLAEVQQELELVLEELDHEKQQTVEYRSIIGRLESHLHTVELHDEQDDDPPTKGLPSSSGPAVMAVRYKETLERAKELEAESSHLRHSLERLKVEREKQKTMAENRLRRQTDELRRVRDALADAEKRVAEGELKLEVAKSLAKRQQESLEQQLAEVVAAKDDDHQAAHRACRDVETALSREVARREAQVAQLERTLEQVRDEQRQDKSAWERRIRDELTAIYIQEKEVYKVQISRELRSLAIEAAEQETEIESLERRYREAADAVGRAETLRKQVEEACADRMHQWEKNEQDLRTTILQLTQKLSSLEYDSLQLFSRNIKLAHQLGQCAP